MALPANCDPALELDAALRVYRLRYDVPGFHTQERLVTLGRVASAQEANQAAEMLPEESAAHHIGAKAVEAFSPRVYQAYAELFELF